MDSAPHAPSLLQMKVYSGLLLLSSHPQKCECLPLLKAMTSHHLSLGPLRLLGWFCSGRAGMSGVLLFLWQFR